MKNNNQSLEQLRQATLLQTVHDSVKTDHANQAVANHPKLASIQHYGPHGARVANQVDADYSEAQFDNQGSLQGGQIQINNHTAEKELLSKSSLVLSSGKLQQATTQIMDVNDNRSVKKEVKTDYGQIEWDERRQISGGQIQITSSSANQVKLSEGQLSYQNSELNKGEFTSYGPDGATQTGASSIDYGDMQTAHHAITGGSMSINHSRADGNGLATKSQIFFDEAGLVKSMLTHNYDTDGSSLESSVETDYQGMFFSARRKIHTGHLVMTVKNAAGKQSSQSTMLFKEGNLLQTATITQDRKQALKNSSLKDYSEAIFGKDGEILGGSKTLYIYHKEGHLLQANVMSYDGSGQMSKQESTIYNEEGAILQGNLKITNADFLTWDKTYTAFGKKNDVLANEVDRRLAAMEKLAVSHKESMALPNLSGTHTKEQSFKRADGTLDKQVSTILTSDNTPLASLFTFYNDDGKTISHYLKTDYQKADFSDGQVVRGQVLVHTFNSDKTIASQSTLQY